MTVFHRLPRQLLVWFAATLAAATTQAGYQANGIKIGEVDQSSAIVWTRTTTVAEAAPSKVDAAPGCPGRTRVTCRNRKTGVLAFRSDWQTTDPDRDFTHQFQLQGLHPDTAYALRVESAGLEADDVNAVVDGSFRTSPEIDAVAPVRFVVVTCQAIGSVDCGDAGHSPYRLIPCLDPDFFVHTGDIVYYDKVPLCKSARTARQKWNRMYGYFYNRDFHANVAAYFMKDDHDTLKNDCWAGQRYGELTWQEGLNIFREQVPMGTRTYRTYRWGRDVQIWLTENRDFRSPNTMPDGPEKTIWGATQKAWLKQSMNASDATFKFLIMPGPLIGPDKRGKADNHSNAAFRHEGDEVRRFVAGLDNLVVINGDRHWQYFSLHPTLMIREFGCGPINDLHVFGGNPGFQPRYHQFFSEKGGWLTIDVDRRDSIPTTTMRFYKTGPDLAQPEVRYEVSFAAEGKSNR